MKKIYKYCNIKKYKMLKYYFKSEEFLEFKSNQNKLKVIIPTYQISQLVYLLGTYFFP